MTQNGHSNFRDDSLLMAAARGAAAGLAATVPMTMAMNAIHRRLPPHQQYDLPPEEITRELEETAGVDDDLTESEHDQITNLSHYAYGAAAGAIYGLLARDTPLKGPAGGIAFGLGVWAGSYLGWLPAMNMRASADREPAGRNGMMIAAHVVWGAAAGMTFSALESES